MKQNTKQEKTEEVSLLTQAGLSEKEAELYEILLKLGKVQASKLVSAVSQKRTTVYAVLEELIKKGLVEKDETEPVVRFRAKHPYALKEYLDEQVRKIKTAEDRVEAALPSFVHLYHQNQNRPGVKFYEGKEGIKKVLFDTLTAPSEICAVINIEMVEKHAKDINDEYVKMRNKKGVKKRILVVDTPYARERYVGKELTDVRLVNMPNIYFGTSLQIYDGKIAYLTATEDYYNATLIEDKHIYTMQQAFFDHLWDTAKTP